MMVLNLRRKYISGQLKLARKGTDEMVQGIKPNERLLAELLQNEKPARPKES